MEEYSSYPPNRKRQLVNPIRVVITRPAMHTRALAVALFLGFCPLSSAAQTPTLSSILVKAGKLLDVRKGAYVENAGIWIEGERIKEVGITVLEQVKFVMKGGAVVKGMLAH